MSQARRSWGWGAVLSLAPLACGGATGPAPKTVRVPGLGFTVPGQWETRAPQNEMRVAEFVLPESNGEATLVLFRFPGGGGSADANVARWISQFRQPGGGPSGDKAKVTSTTRPPLTLTQLDVRGSY